MEVVITIVVLILIVVLKKFHKESLRQQEVLLFYLRDLILLHALEEEDLSDRANSERRDLIDGIIEQIRTMEGLEALSLILKKRGYTNYNPDGEQGIID